MDVLETALTVFGLAGTLVTSPRLRSNSGARLEQFVRELRFTSTIATSSSGSGQQRSTMSGPGDDR
jgi:hypothetical protein